MSHEMRPSPRTFGVAGEGMRGVTDMGRVFGSPAGSGGAISRDGPVRSTPIPFTLVAGEPLNIATANEHRVGLLLQNRDAAANIFYNFGSTADIRTFSLVPGQVILLDFICPTDAVWCFANAAASGMYTEFARIASFR